MHIYIYIYIYIWGGGARSSSRGQRSKNTMNIFPCPSLTCRQILALAMHLQMGMIAPALNPKP